MSPELIEKIVIGNVVLSVITFIVSAFNLWAIRELASAYYEDLTSRIK